MHTTYSLVLAAAFAASVPGSAVGQAGAAARPSGKVAWQTAYARALTDARAAKGLVLVAVYEPGEAGSEATARDVWRHASFVKALGKDVVPVLVCVGETWPAGTVESLLGAGGTESARRDGLAAVRTLFGPGATLTTPQHLVVHPEHGVLWHDLRQAELSRVLRGVEGARTDGKRGAAAQKSRLRGQVGQLAKAAGRDPLAFERLNALVRNASTAHFGMIFECLGAERQLGERLLRGAFAAQPAPRMGELLRQLEDHKECRGFVAFAREREAEARRASPCRVREIVAPLPEVRTAESLAAVRFVDGKARTLGECRGRPTVLLFLLPDAAELASQLAALTPVIEELAGEGVQCLALFAAVEPDASLAHVAGLGLPCPAGVYAYASDKPFCGVGYFPGALVLDDAGRVVLADDGPGNREYAGFAPTARGLARYLQQRPVLAGGGSNPQ